MATTTIRNLSVEDILRNADCVYSSYSPDRCFRHNSAWLHDERVCNAIIRMTGVQPRRSLGDGRASGAPIYPR